MSELLQEAAANAEKLHWHFRCRLHLQNFTVAMFCTKAQVVSQSERLVTFSDLCGHEKYLKTTIFGLVGQCPCLRVMLDPRS